MKEEPCSPPCIPEQITSINAPDLSQDDLRSLLSAELSTAMKGHAYIQDVFPGYFIFRNEKTGKLNRQRYRTSSGEAKLLGKPTEVIRVTEYRELKKALSDGVHEIALKKLKAFLRGKG